MHRFRLRRVASILIFLCFIVVLAASSALIIGHASTCVHEHCAICLTIQSLHSVLRTFVYLALGWLLALGLAARVRCSCRWAALFSQPMSLVTQNIRMNN